MNSNQGRLVERPWIERTKMQVLPLLVRYKCILAKNAVGTRASSRELEAVWSRLQQSKHTLKMARKLAEKDPRTSQNGHLLSILLRQYPQLRNALRIEATNVLKIAKDKERPVLFAQIHEGKIYPLTTTLLQERIPHVRPNSNPPKFLRKVCSIEGSMSLIKFIDNGPTSLISYRKFYQNGYSLCCAIDKMNPSTGNVMLSAAVFEIAKRLSMRVVLVKSSVSDNCVISLNCLEIRNPKRATSCIDEFKSFLNIDREIPINFED